MSRIKLRESQLRKIIRESLLLERPFSGIPLADFNDAVIDNAAKIAAGADPNATAEEVESAKAFMNQLGDSSGVVELLSSLGEKWNNSALGFVIKVPGLAGAENYEWSDFAIDAFLLVAGGAIAGNALKGVALAGSRGAAAARAARGIYATASRKVGPGVMRKAVQQGMKALGATPTDAIVKSTLTAMRDAAKEDIVIEMTPQEFEEAMDLMKAEGKPVLQSDTELAKLADEANQAFGIDV